MIYTQLPPAYKYDTLADAIYAREVEYFHYELDRSNFEHLLGTLEDFESKTDIAERLASTTKQMRMVEAVMDALRAQIDDQQAYADAVERVTAKRKAKESA
jgi:IS5 family transposase